MGGVFRHVNDLVHEQASQGYDVGIVCDVGPGPTATEDQLNELSSHCRLGVHRLPIPRLPRPADLVNQRRLRAILAETTPAVVHGHGAKGGVLARLASNVSDATVVYSPHGGVLHFRPRSASGLLFHGLERRLLARTDGLIFVCEYESARYKELIGGTELPSAVVYNGLHRHEWSLVGEPDSAEYDFVFVGELRELKGVLTLCEAFRRIRLRRPARLLIVGSGPDAATFRSWVGEQGLAESIHFAPPVRRAADAFAAGRCVVVPSHAESFPYIVLEAAATGRPMVATSAGGIPEIYGPLAGSLVTPADAGALAERLDQFLVDPSAARSEAALLAARVSSRFTIESMASSIGNFYVDCARAATPPEHAASS
jgi:glycosyltransferase involved in cell wall biosynthesis